MKEKTYFEIFEEMEKNKESKTRIDLREKCLNAIKRLEKNKDITAVNNLVKINDENYDICITRWKGSENGTSEI